MKGLVQKGCNHNRLHSLNIKLTRNLKVTSFHNSTCIISGSVEGMSAIFIIRELHPHFNFWPNWRNITQNLCETQIEYYRFYTKKGGLTAVQR
jgi:hypothetical protein